MSKHSKDGRHHSETTTTTERKRPGAPKGNQNGRRHGLFSQLHPVDFVDVFQRLRREQGHPPMDADAARRLAALTRDPRMSPRLLADTLNAMQTLISFERAIRRLQELKPR